MRTLVLGIGNPILRDDGVGVHVVRKLKRAVRKEDACFLEVSSSGLDTIEAVRDFDRLIIVDAIRGEKPGAVLKLRLEDVQNTPTLHFSSSHDLSIVTAIEVGKKLGVKMPSEIVVYAVGVEDAESFGERCTAEVEKAIPKVAERIASEL